MVAKPPPAYDMSLADHGFDATELKGLRYPLGDHAPTYGEVYQIAPDIGWVRLPVPGDLGHINNWLLDDGGSDFAIVDTGLFIPDVTEQWKAMIAGPLAGRSLSRVIVTHFHPDHVGCAGWLANKYKVKVWMNRTEWLLARLLTTELLDEPPQEVIDRRIFAGYDEARIDALRAGGWANFAKMVARLPSSHVHLADGAHVPIGNRVWQVLVGSGHTPEHACLVDHHNGVIISGDQILPRISSNISLTDFEPEGDPLGEWLRSIAKFHAALPPDMLVLPAHGQPFTGVHVRLEKLASGHHAQLDALEEALRHKEMRAVDTFALLFAREIDDSVFGMATGEARAHLRHLERTGRAICEVRDGVGWYHAT